MILFLSVLCCVLLARPQRAGALELYMRPVVLAERDGLELRDLVRSNGDGEAGALLARPLGYTAERLTLLPPRMVRERLADLYSGPLVLVGGRSRIIPVGRSSGVGVWFFSRLLEFIEGLEPEKDGRLEIDILAGSDLPSAGAAAEPVFSLVRAERRMGRLAGSARITYVLQGESREGSREGRSGERRTLELWIHHHVRLPRLKAPVGRNETFGSEDIELVETDLSLMREAASEPMLEVNPEEEAEYTARRRLPAGRLVRADDVDAGGSIRAGDEVTIRFNRGAIRLEIPGRAVRSGTLGETIPVYPRGIRKRFDGIITGPKEVEVDVP